ncbi:MAG: hypothetical protein LBD06_03160 [Candidatus Accumulibacter sp.]|jgi:NAD(P)-dependent dehydrogenase (short-subunit alcohol dehydrogenase family)|nr:hypothetical protein [Accumulibacter sp.]
MPVAQNELGRGFDLRIALKGGVSNRSEFYDEASVAAMAEKLEAGFGTPDALVNDAGKTSVMLSALLDAKDWDAAKKYDASLGRGLASKRSPDRT